MYIPVGEKARSTRRPHSNSAGIRRWEISKLAQLTTVALPISIHVRRGLGREYQRAPVQICVRSICGQVLLQSTGLTYGFIREIS